MPSQAQMVSDLIRQDKKQVVIVEFPHRNGTRCEIYSRRLEVIPILESLFDHAGTASSGARRFLTNKMAAEVIAIIVAKLPGAKVAVLVSLTHLMRAGLQNFQE